MWILYLKIHEQLQPREAWKECFWTLSIDTYG
jgi:hypothetical protein